LRNSGILLLSQMAWSQTRELCQYVTAEPHACRREVLILGISDTTLRMSDAFAVV